MNHKTDMQAALRAALELTRYAAAPFFSKKERKRDADKNVTYIYPTTEEWWDGLREQIESVQPLI